MYQALQEAIESRGAMIFFLPPYSPQLNPIEVAFSNVKRYIQKHGNKLFHEEPEAIMDAAFRSLCNPEGESLAVNLYGHCGYYDGELTIGDHLIEEE
jgi:transposase